MTIEVQTADGAALHDPSSQTIELDVSGPSPGKTVR
jgi:hypothetical protein